MSDDDETFKPLPPDAAHAALWAVLVLSAACVFFGQLLARFQSGWALVVSGGVIISIIVHRVITARYGRGSVTTPRQRRLGKIWGWSLGGLAIVAFAITVIQQVTHQPVTGLTIALFVITFVFYVVSAVVFHVSGASDRAPARQRV